MLGYDFNGAGEMIPVDKPRDWTSFDVVRKVRNLFHIKKIGHAGTLDPLATGLLILCTGPRTKELNALLEYDKVYTGSFEIGIETDSYDLETDITARKDCGDITEEQVRAAMTEFTGAQQQIPPMYSALKHKGKALYKYARAGKTVARSPRDVVVHECDITAVDLPRVDFVLRCSKGTYVRSLIHDIGQTLGVGAVLTSLRRVKIGPWDIADAYSVDQLIQIRDERISNEQTLHGVLLHS